jgi:hypothetical protein
MSIFSFIGKLCLFISFSLSYALSFSQIVINEGSNRNFSTVSDEDGDHPDWIEIYNNTGDTVNLFDYALTDDLTEPRKWIFPYCKLAPYDYKLVFCSNKNRKPISGFQEVLNATNYNPVVGWNTHSFTSPFYWDGNSNIMINTCSYSNTGYTTNSVFNQTSTNYHSTVFSFVDNSDDACLYNTGVRVMQRPNIRLNGYTIGTGTINNGNLDYPAPYGNWYWSARNQMLITAAELRASGLQAGMINSLAFDVTQTDPSTVYTYITFNLKMVTENEVSNTFQPLNNQLFLHTNFSLNSSGETVYLVNPASSAISQLKVDCINVGNSKGALPDATSTQVFFSSPTPGSSNNGSQAFTQYLQQPIFSKPSGQYTGTQIIQISNPNTVASTIHYTLDGSDPTINSTPYAGGNITISSSKVLKARVFGNGALPSPLKAASYLIGISHTTPVLSVITESSNLYGSTGIFDNWSQDWEKPAYAELFNTDKSLIFSQPAGIQIDGGAGGSRSHPQHSFRLELDHSVLGGGSVSYPLLPDKPTRNKYSKIYLRNGSNQFLRLPYKDAVGVKVLCDETYNYYSAYRPISVYINGSYFGVYELREKFDDEYFNEAEGADSTELLSQSYWYGSVLRALSGSVDSFYAASDAVARLDPGDANFWEKADRHFDLQYYTDYVIAESFIHNTDWPFNNIKIYRSEKTRNRYRFAVIDVELSLQPFGWSSSDDDPISFLYNSDPNNRFINIWLNGIRNARFKNYFINRYADILNTSYLPSKLADKENAIYNQIYPEMIKTYQRWGDPNNISQQMNDFRDAHLALRSEYISRGQKVRNFMETGFSLAGQSETTLDVFPKGAGKIKISTITPDSLPWKGIYFHGNPVVITAIDNPGYRFDHWQPNLILTTADTNRSITVDIPQAMTFKAIFKALPKDTTVISTPSTFLLYPNPVQEEASLFFNQVPNGKYDFSVTDEIGRVVMIGTAFVQNGNLIRKISFKQLTSGVYYIRILGNGNDQTLKFIKTNR